MLLNVQADQSLAMQNMLEDMFFEKRGMNDQRAAIFNILDDVNQAQEELLLANKSLGKRKFELEALKSLGDELTGTLDIRAAIDSVNKYLWEVLDYSLATYMVYDPSTGEFEFRANLKESVSEEFLLKARTELANYISSKADPGVATAAEEMAAKKGDLKASLSGQPLSGMGNQNFNSSFILPLSVGEKILGALHISSTKPNLYQNPGEREIVNAMVATVSVSIARLQTLLLSQHSRTESLIESLSNGVIMFDAQKRVILANPVAVKLTGLPKEGYFLNELYKLFSGAKLDEIVSRVLADGKTAKIDKTNVVNYVFEVVTTPVRDFKENIVGGAIILHDITHITEVDRMKTEFMSVAAHQLRTPLGSMRWNLEMLIDGDAGELSNEVKKQIAKIYESDRHLIDLVNDLLNVSRIEQGRVEDNPTETQVEDVIAAAIEEASGIAQEKGVKLTFSRTKDLLPKIMIDQKRFREVVTNLISNAIKYNGKQNGIVDVVITQDSDKFDMIVADNGIGIPVQDQGKIFSKFYRGENAIRSETEGSGLGLFVVKSYVEGWGGKVSFQSTEGKGTMFTVTIPYGLKT